MRLVAEQFDHAISRPHPVEFGVDIAAPWRGHIDQRAAGVAHGQIAGPTDRHVDRLALDMA